MTVSVPHLRKFPARRRVSVGWRSCPKPPAAGAVSVLRANLGSDGLVAFHAPPSDIGFDVRSSTSASLCTVAVCGEVDSVTAPVLRDCLLDVFGRPSPPVAVVLDLSQVSFLSAAGLTALAIAHREADLAGLGLGIRCGTARAVIRPLVITGLWNVFPIV